MRIETYRKMRSMLIIQDKRNDRKSQWRVIWSALPMMGSLCRIVPCCNRNKSLVETSSWAKSSVTKAQTWPILIIDTHRWPSRWKNLCRRKTCITLKYHLQAALRSTCSKSHHHWMNKPRWIRKASEIVRMTPSQWVTVPTYQCLSPETQIEVSLQ